MALAYQNQQLGQYKRMKIETATPEMLILMLYDGAVKNITLAREIMGDRSKIDQCSNHFIKAQNIITELMVSLNFEIGGEIARNLFNIYEFINYTLAQANITKSEDNLDTVITMLKDLKGTWQEVIRINRERYPAGLPSAEEIAAREGRPNPDPEGGVNPLARTENIDVAVSENEEVPPAPEPEKSVTSSTRPQPGQQNRFKQIYGKVLPRK